MKTLSIIFLSLFSSFVFSEERLLSSNVTTERYISSIEGEDRCILPSDPNFVRDGECKIIFKTVDFGEKIVEDSGICKKVTSVFDGYKTTVDFGHTINMPKAKYTVEIIPCP